MNRNFKITLVLLSSIIGFAIFAYIISWMMAPGSYPRAETYIFDVPEDTLIKIINEVKNENPEIDLTKQVQIPNGLSIYLEEGRRDENDHWYSIYFYYSDKNEILETWTRPKNRNSTTFAFVAINSGLTLGNWRTVNESFWWWLNKPEIEEFEDRILKKIEEKARHNTRL